MISPKKLSYLSWFTAAFFLFCNIGNKQLDNPITAGSAAGCNECHLYPGTVMCQQNSFTVNGLPRTACIECHSGSITMDSVIMDSTRIGFDAQILTRDTVWPAPGPLHTNGTVDLVYSQCIHCHSLVPQDTKNPAGIVSGNAISGHKAHIIDYSNKCIECHFGTVSYTTSSRFIDPETLVTFRDSLMTGFDGSKIPAVKAQTHRNGRIEVAFTGIYERIPPRPGTDTLYKWNDVEKSCSNIRCHGGPGDSLYPKTYWGAP